MTRAYGRQGISAEYGIGASQENVPGTGFEAVVPNPKLKLMDQVREVLRLRHYSIRTERCYCDWIRRYIKFHRMQSRADLDLAESKIEVFLSDLAVNGHVAASTQNQAFNALLFLYQQVLHQKLGNVQAVRSTRPVRVPVVLTPEEVKQVLTGLTGTPLLVGHPHSAGTPWPRGRLDDNDLHARPAPGRFRDEKSLGSPAVKSVAKSTRKPIVSTQPS